MATITRAVTSHRARRTLGALLLHAALLAGVIAFGFPLYWTVATAVLPSQEVFRYPPQLLPLHGSLEPFVSVINRNPLPLWLLNSTLVSASSSLGSVLLGAFGAYALSRYRFIGRTAAAVLILVTQMLPGSLIIIPIYVIYRDLQLLDSLWGLALGYVTFNLPFCIWILKGFFDGIPVDLEEAGLVDGCNRLSAMFRITLPLVLPGTVATFMFAFISAWADYVFALTVLNRTENFTYAIGLAALKGEWQTPWNEIMAGSFLSILPVFFLFLFLQRYLLAGLTAGGVKG
jgi:ABC-type glycerol-3-phosphate transport system permease component